MSQKPSDIGRKFWVAAKRELKLGQKRPKQEKRKVSWTSILTEIPQKMHKKF